MKQFINKPFEITQEYTSEYRVFPVRAEDKKKWAEVFSGISYSIVKIGWSANKENVKPYIGPINENNDDDFNVTPDEKEWNVLDIGSIVTVDFKEETNRDDLSDVWQFTGIPFKIVSEDEVDDDLWYVEPYRAEDKIKWKETHEIYLKRHNFKPTFWTDQGWEASKENVKPYQG